MCGPNSLFVGRLGDWTWDAVSHACATNAYDARTSSGDPVYLSFYYFHIRAGRAFHPLSLRFGDRLRVASRVFGFGSESVLALHRIRRQDAAPAAPGPALAPAAPIDPDEFYAYADPDSIYVENFNRWIVRGRPDSNRDLMRSSPVGLRHRHLPVLPPQHSPRAAYTHARTQLTFRQHEHAAPPTRLTVDYPTEPSRDLNGVGLLYFASYFSITDWALLRLWRRLGRTDRSYLRRTVLDHRMCYLGNADADAVLSIELAASPDPDDPAADVVDTVLRERSTGRTLAVSTQWIHREDAS
jgi:probable biosynthetic protein (TIGR04098 family)